MIYIASIFIAFIFGFFVGKSINKSDAVVQSDITDNRIMAIKEMLAAVKKNKSLSLSLNKSVLKALIEIANTPNWESQINEETIVNLYDIYKRWINAKSSETDAITTKESGGFNYTKYWEGTWEEYLQARNAGDIDDQTKVVILTKTGSVLTMDENGEIEEFME